jgi:hypothetical protein
MVQRFPIFMEGVPEYSIRDENMHIVWPTLEIVLPVETMLNGMASAKAEIAKWVLSRTDRGEVVQFPMCG